VRQPFFIVGLLRVRNILRIFIKLGELLIINSPSFFIITINQEYLAGTYINVYNNNNGI